jgi:hypothetical protein
MVATQKLATVMLRETRLASAWRWVVVPLVIAAVAFGVGAGCAWLTRAPFLLDLAAGELPRSEKKETAKEQYDHAMDTGIERDFLAVEQYFPLNDPENLEYVRKAQYQLANIYENTHRQDEALRILVDLTAQDADVSLRIRAFVLQANILSRQATKAQEAIAKVIDLADVMQEANRTAGFDRGSIPTERTVESWLESSRLKDEFRNRFRATSADEDNAANRRGPPGS